MTSGFAVQIGTSRPGLRLPERAFADGGHLPRPRLDSVMQDDWWVLEVRAGPGFGKTALVSNWVREAEVETTWLKLDCSLNDPQRMHAALKSATACLSPGAVLVLDDAGTVRSCSSWHLVDHYLEQFRMVVISRSPAGLHLARWRTQGMVRTLFADDLRFTLRETATLMGTYLQSRLANHQIQVLWTITRGWVAGLMLAFVAERQIAGATQFDHRHWQLWDRLVDDYFLEEVLAPLPDDLRALVLKTADLPYLGLDLGVPELDAATLHRLRAAIPLLEQDLLEPAWYRYDPLLAATLRREARVVQATPVRNEAVRHLLNTHRVRAAADLAVRGENRELLVEAVSALGPHLERMSYFDEMITWLELIPGQQRAGRPDPHQSSMLNHPDLDYWWMLSRLGLGRTFGVGHRLRQVEPQWLATGGQLATGRLHLLHGMLAFHQGDGQIAISRLREARATLPESAEMEHLYAATLEGTQFQWEGRDDLAIEPLATAERVLRHQSIHARWGWRTVAADRANTYALRGDARSATTKYELMLAEIPAEIPDVEGFLRCRLLAVQLERNQIAEAEANYERIDELLGMEHNAWRSGPAIARIQAILRDHRRIDDADWYHDAAVARLRLLLAQGRVGEAEQWGGNHLKLVRHLPQKTQIVLLLAGVWFERREWPMVESWLRDLGSGYWPWIRVFGDINPRLMAIDLDLARGNEAPALRRSEAFVTQAAERSRWSEYVAGSMRLALARDLAGDGDGSRQALAGAARVGLPGGFVQAFHVPGWDLERRFATTWADYALPRRDTRATTEQRLVTQREIEVLNLVAEGMTNKQIATTLFISVNTVRNHLVRISRRLEAGSRTEVVARARGMGLIG